MAKVILLVGMLIFVAHFLSHFFRKTNIPDVLVLMMIGIIAGPVMGVVKPEQFGEVGSVISTIALVVILFESGTSLDLKVLGGSLGFSSCPSFSIKLTDFTNFTLVRLAGSRSAGYSMGRSADY